MALTSLPPVFDRWTEEDLSKLTIEEIERLHLLMYNKLYALEQIAEQRTIFYNKHNNKKRKKEEEEEEEENNI